MVIVNYTLGFLPQLKEFRDQLIILIVNTRSYANGGGDDINTEKYDKNTILNICFANILQNKLIHANFTAS
jgi:hypothetical protein